MGFVKKNNNLCPMTVFEKSKTQQIMSLFLTSQ